MATVVDALTVTLGLDNSNFKKGQEEVRHNLHITVEAAVKAGKEMQASGAQAAQFFSQIKTEALSLLGIFLGGRGIESFVRDTTKSLADLGRAARNIDISPSDLNAFTAAMERMGGSAQSAMASLEGIARAQQQWKTFGNNPEFNAFLSLIGANPNMKPLDIVSRFSEFAKGQQGQPGGVQRIQQTGAGIGLDQATINSIIQLTKTSTLSAELERSRELIPLTKDMVDHLTTLQTSMVSLEQAILGLSTVMLDKVAPRLSRFIDTLTNDIAHPGAARPTDFMPDWMTNIITFGQGPGWGGKLYDRLFAPSQPSGAPPATGRGGPRTGAWKPGGFEASSAAEDAMSFWISKGLTPAQAAGMAAQEQAESGGNPGARGDYDKDGNPTAHGAYQWHRTRRENILAKTGIDVSTATIQQQREAAYWELMNVEHEARRRLLASTTPGQAGAAATEFERPGNRLGEEVTRGAIAAGIMRRMAPNGIPRKGPTFGPSALDGPGPVTVHNPADFILPAPLPGPRATNEDNSSSVTIGNINIHTQATDAKGVAGSLRDEIANQANRGAN